RRWVPYPFVRFTIYFIIGTLGGIYLEGWIKLAVASGAVAMVFYVLFQVLSAKGIHQYFALPVGICAFFALVLLGYINLHLSDEKNEPSHLHHKMGVDGLTRFYQTKVIAPLKEKQNSF